MEAWSRKVAAAEKVVSAERKDEKVSIPAGEFIRQELEVRKWTQADLGKILDRPVSTINELILGKRAISPEIAVDLGIAFGTGPEVWMEREAVFRLSQVSKDTGEVRRRARLYELAPIKEMQKRGWIGPADSPDEIEKELLRFFDVPNLEAEPAIDAVMRKTAPDRPLTPAQRAWCCRVKGVAKALRVAEFKEMRLDACARDLRKLAAFPQEARKVPNLLASYGIRFVVVEPLAGGKVDGMAAWIDETAPAIGMSLRFDRNDAFWHTLCHEFTHIRHRDVAPPDTDAGDHDGPVTEVKPEFERRADEEGASLLVDPGMLRSFILRVGPLYSKERINQFANRIKMHPGIIVGQLHHRGEIGYHANREMLAKVRQTVTSVAVCDGWGQTIDPKVFL